MIRAIDDFPSFFSLDGADPLIIDCGANIGVSVLEWKARWPMARVICFEPDPDAFRLLAMNIERNDVPGVRCIQAAVSDQDGRCELYGDLGKGADARGNSIERAWGEREGTSVVEVSCRRLSPYLQPGPIAFLKMDIEGAEHRVLQESSSMLRQVNAIYVEVHETDELQPANSCELVSSLLRDAGFTVDSESRYEPHALPTHLQPWQEMTGAHQTQLLGWREVEALD